MDRDCDNLPQLSLSLRNAVYLGRQQPRDSFSPDFTIFGIPQGAAPHGMLRQGGGFVPDNDATRQELHKTKQIACQGLAVGFRRRFPAGKPVFQTRRIALMLLRFGDAIAIAMRDDSESCQTSCQL